jgi:hypothetical protein
MKASIFDSQELKQDLGYLGQEFLAAQIHCNQMNTQDRSCVIGEAIASSSPLLIQK